MAMHMREIPSFMFKVLNAYRDILSTVYEQTLVCYSLDRPTSLLKHCGQVVITIILICASQSHLLLSVKGLSFPKGFTLQ